MSTPQDFKKCPSCGAQNNPSSPLCENCDYILSDVLITSGLGSNALPKTGKNKQRTVVWKPFVLATIIILLLLLIGLPSFFALRLFLTRSEPSHVTSSLPVGLGTITLSDGEVIGVNDGSYPPFDMGRSAPEMAFKQQAAAHLKTDAQAAISHWQDALKVESNDAEALIYLEDQSVVTSGKPHITLIIGTAFTSPFPDTASEEILQGAYVAQHQYNELHSDSTQLLLLIANSGNTANDVNTTQVTRQIVQIAHQDPTVIGVIGWSGSASTLQALSVLSQGKIPLISPKASSDQLHGSSYFFRVVPPNIQEAQVGAMFAQNTLHVKNPVVFLDRGNAFSENLAHDFEQQFADVNHNLQEEQFTTGSTTQAQFAASIQDALKHHADAFYFTSASNIDTGRFQDALPTSAPPTIAGDGSYVAHANSYGRWYFTTFAYHSESTTPIATQFAQAYSDDFNPYHQKPTGYYGYSLADDHAILSYDAVSVALDAVGRAYAQGKTTLTPQILADTLPQITGANAFQGVSGQISFGPNHDPINKAIIVLTVSKQGHIEMDNGIEGCFLKGSC